MVEGGPLFVGIMQIFLFLKIPITIKFNQFYYIRTNLHNPDNCWNVAQRSPVGTSLRAVKFQERGLDTAKKISIDIHGNICVTLQTTVTYYISLKLQICYSIKN